MRALSAIKTTLLQVIGPVFAATLAIHALAACGGSNSGSGDAGLTPECTTSDDCPDGQTCQPFSQTCETPGATCTGHAQCTDDTYCEGNPGVCLPSSIGSPCAGPDNCADECVAGLCGCSGLVHERQLQGGPLDVFLILDRTGSMGTDCDYTPGNPPPVASKGMLCHLRAVGLLDRA